MYVVCGGEIALRKEARARRETEHARDYEAARIRIAE
jgi:hypothetical protein